MAIFFRMMYHKNNVLRHWLEKKFSPKSWKEFQSMHQNLKIFNYLSLHSFFRNCFGPQIQQFLDPISIILPQMDFLKDMILVVRLITLLGGMVVFTNPHQFSSNVKCDFWCSNVIIWIWNWFIILFKVQCSAILYPTINFIPHKSFIVPNEH